MDGGPPLQVQINSAGAYHNHGTRGAWKFQTVQCSKWPPRALALRAKALDLKVKTAGAKRPTGPALVLLDIIRRKGIEAIL